MSQQRLISSDGGGGGDMSVGNITRVMKSVLRKAEADQKTIIQKLIRDEIERARPAVGAGGSFPEGEDLKLQSRRLSRKETGGGPSGTGGGSGGSGGSGGGEKAMTALVAGDLISLRVEGALRFLRLLDLKNVFILCVCVCVRDFFFPLVSPHTCPPFHVLFARIRCDAPWHHGREFEPSARCCAFRRGRRDG